MLLRTACIAVLLVLDGPISRSAEQTVFRSTVDNVAIYVTVHDATGRLVPGLSQQDFRLLDNDLPVDVVVFSADPQPLTLVVMLDLSASMSRHLVRMRQATKRFIEALSPRDRISIGSFRDEEIIVNPNLTNDRTVLGRVIEEELWPGGTSPVWEALDAAMSALASQPGRRVVLVFSDGVNTSKTGATKGQVRRRGTTEGTMVYALGLASGDLTDDLRALAMDTGGGFVEIGAGADLNAAMDSIAEELRQQYLLGFTPRQLDGAVHTLSLQMAIPGLKAKGPKTYVASVRR